MRAARPHGPTVTGRMRTDPGPLVLIGVVIAVATILLSATPPLLARASDSAISATVRDAGSRGALVATYPRLDSDVNTDERDPQAADELRVDARYARSQLSRRLAGVLQPGITSLTTSSLHLIGSGPGRYLRLAFLDSPGGPPATKYVAGGPPRAGTPVQIAVSSTVADALHLRPGVRLSAEDSLARQVDLEISGVFEASRTQDAAWATVPQLLSPVTSSSQGVTVTTGAALASASSLPDLRLGVPAEDLTEVISYRPRPDAVHADTAASLGRAVVALEASPNVARGKVGWDSALDLVLADGLARIAAARGQAEVLLFAVVACALLVLVQAADLVVRRRAGSIVVTRERGGTLPVIALELYVEAVLAALAGCGLGLAVTFLTVGDAAWLRCLPLPLLAALAAAVLGALLAGESTDPRRTPANRSARRRRARARALREALFVGAVLAAAALTFVAVHQRGVGPGDLTASGAPTWWAVAGALLLVRLLPRLGQLLVARSRRSRGLGGLVVASRLSLVRALPFVVVTVLVAQLAFALVLAVTERDGQSSGALAEVGGDVRVTTTGGSATDLAGRIAAARGVRAAVPARVEDDVRATSRQSSATVRLVIVDASAYRRLLARSPLPDAPDLSRLRRGGAKVPALLLGGPRGLGDGLELRAADGTAVPVSVVGTAPDVESSPDPVVVVDRQRYTATGAVADPDTVWAVGPGAAAAARAAAGATDEVVSYAGVLAEARDAPLTSGLLRLSVTTAVLLLLLAGLAVVLEAVRDAQPRGIALGRLRALGMSAGHLWRLLAGELLAPVVTGSVAGLVLGLACAASTFGSLSLQRITGEPHPPALVVPWWTPLPVVLLAAVALLRSYVEWRRLRRLSLGVLLRTPG